MSCGSSCKKNTADFILSFGWRLDRQNGCVVIVFQVAWSCHGNMVKAFSLVAMWISLFLIDGP